MIQVKVDLDEETVLNSVTPADAVAIYGVDKLLDVMDKSDIADYFSSKKINILSEMNADDVVHMVGINNILGNIDPDELIKYYGVDMLGEMVDAYKKEQAAKATEALKKAAKKQ